MSMVSKSQSKRLLAVHGWSGTVLGLILYVVILTGAVAVFSAEIGTWSAGGMKAKYPLDRTLDSELRLLASQVDKRYLEEVAIYTNSGGDIIANFHSHGKNPNTGNLDEVGTRFYLNPNDLSIIERQDGWFSELPSDAAGALDEFIVDLHVNLYAPFPYGLYATGILGLVMLIAVISGILLHKHLIKDIFVAPRLSSLLLNKRDRHVLAGSWGIPFGFILAFTGTFFSFAGSIGIPVVAMTAFGGDQQAMIETLVGNPQTPDKTPQQLFNLDTIIAQSIAEAKGTPPMSITISHWGQADASVSLYHESSDADLYGNTYLFKGTTGEYQGIKPLLGKKPSLGSATLGLMGPLHFGNFGGLLSKIVWFSLGLAMCYVTITGLQLWVQRRREEPSWQWMPKVISMVTWGIPLSLCISGVCFFAALSSHQTHSWTALGFLISLIFVILLTSIIKSHQLITKLLQFLLFASLFSLPISRMVFGGNSWATLFNSNQALVIGIDIAFFLAAICLLLVLINKSIDIPSSKDQMIGAIK